MSSITYGNLQIWDGISDDLADFSDITIQDERILSCSPGTDKNSKDCSGLFAIPGLIDAHIHLCLNPEITDPEAHGKLPEQQILSEMRERVRAMVRAGITTARDLGGGAWLELAIRDEISKGELEGPRLICSGQPITSIRGHCHFWGGEAANLDEALIVLERQHEKGVDLIKVMATGGNLTPGSKPADSQFDDATLAAVVEAATRHGYHVAAHCHGTDGIRQAAQSGVTTVEHCSWVGKEGWGKSFDADVVTTLAQEGVWVSPTINAGWHRFLAREEFVSMVQANYKNMKQAGVKLIASTDAGIPNVKHHDLPRALPVFARFAEMNNVETLRSATSECARAIGLSEVTGQIKPGLVADLVFYEGNPLDDLSVLLSPVQVISHGREIF